MADVGKVKELRKRTAAGIMDCRKALAYAEGDVSKAEQVIWQKRQRDGLWLSDRPAGKAGVIHSYIHHGSRIGAMVELLCDTDFAARTDEFRTFAHDLAMHIAAEKPGWLKMSDIPPSEFIGMQRDGLERRCLLTQPHIKDQTRTVGELLDELSAKIGERCIIGRFERWEVGDRSVVPRECHRSVMPPGWKGRTAGARLFILAFLVLTAIGAVILNALL
jgi:elongation factor Ts